MGHQEADTLSQLQLQLQLKQSANAFKAIMEIIPGQLFLKDRDLRYSEANSSFLSTIGKSRDEVIGKTVGEVFGDAPDLADTYSHADKVLLDIGHQSYETQVQVADGIRRDVLVNKSVIYDEEGKFEGIIGLVIDITENKKVEKERTELKERLLLLQQAYEYTNDSVFIIDFRSGTIVDVNRVAQQQHGYSYEELVGNTLSLIKSDDFSLEAWKESVQDLETETLLNYQHRHRRKDGSVFPVDIYATLIAYKGEKYIISTVHDITKEEHYRRELRGQKEFLDTVLANIKDGVLTCDAEGNLTYMNPASRVFYGFDEESELVCPSEQSTLFHVDGTTPLSHEEMPFVQALHKGEIHEVEMVIAPENRAPRYVVANGQAIYDATGEKTGAVVSIHDITKRKAAQEALAQQAEEMKHLANTDPLTGIANRLKFNTILDHHVALSGRYSNALSLLYFDIDHFKKINDTYGHKVGDGVLIEIVELIKALLRQSDLLARWGGEEFVVILPETSIEQAKVIAEKLRSCIETHLFMNVSDLTCSFGVTQLRGDDTEQSFLIRADKALYQAKEVGRNRVVALE